jgi:DNA repair exonuclease SbcCD ATPase subunit
MPELTPQEPFDYESLDEVTRAFVEQKTNETHGLLKRTAEHIIQIGQNLLEVQKRLPEMKFSAWLRAEFAFSRRTAYNFMKVATKFGGSCATVAQLPATILYELASASDEIIQQVENGALAPDLDAIKAAKEAERQARAEVDTVQRHLSTAHKEMQEQQCTIEQLTHQIASLQEQIARLSAQAPQIKEVEKVVVPAEVKAHIEALHQQLSTMKEQRDALAGRVRQLAEEARAAAQRHGESEQERRIRLNWYRVTSEFHAVVTRLLSQWPSPLDTLAFDASDWARLSQTKDLAQRFLAECCALSETRIVESTPRGETYGASPKS